MADPARPRLSASASTAYAWLGTLPVRAVARLGRWSAVTVLLALTTAVLLFGLWQKYPCNNGHPEPGVGWTHLCYSDVLPLYPGRGLSRGLIPYLDSKIEYPVLTGVYMGLIGLPIHYLASHGRLTGPAHALGFETVDEGVVNFWATSVVNGLLVLLITWLLLQLRRDRPRDVLFWALAPSMAFAYTVNWDVLAVAPTIAALLAWQRRRPGWAGVLLGVGTAAKLFPGLLLLPIVLLCLRKGTPIARRAAAQVTTAAVLTWVAVNLPVELANPTNWWETYRFSEERWIDWGTLYYLADHICGGIGLHDVIWPAIHLVPDLNRTSLLLFLAAMLGLSMLILRAPQPPRLAATAFLVVAAFLLTNKVWSQQFVMWLLPLALLARPRWKSLLVWWGAELAYLFAFLRVVIGGKDDYALVQTGVARYLALAVMAGLVVADVLRPADDVLRGGDLSDPDAGVLAADRDEAGLPEAGASGATPPEGVPGDADLPEEPTAQGRPMVRAASSLTDVHRQ
jgi:Glycosyltransferase family 87